MNKIILLFAAVFSFLFAGSIPAGTHGQGITISPDNALDILLKGNLRFVKGQIIHPHQSAKVRTITAKEGQKPIAAILGCSDSRVPPEILFDAGIGDIFVVRNAGNISGKEVAGSLEYAIDHLGVRLIVVLGHTKCGAVTAAVNDDKATGNIITIVNEINPAVTKTKAVNKNLTGEKLVLESVKANVRQSIEKIISSSGLIKKRLQAGDITIVGGIYDIETGTVTVLRTTNYSL